MPVKTIFEYLQKNYSLEEFLEYFPSGTENIAQQVIAESEDFKLELAG